MGVCDPFETIDCFGGEDEENPTLNTIWATVRVKEGGEGVSSSSSHAQRPLNVTFPYWLPATWLDEGTGVDSLASNGGDFRFPVEQPLPLRGWGGWNTFEDGAFKSENSPESPKRSISSSLLCLIRLIVVERLSGSGR
jgi:hypothetical protein